MLKTYKKSVMISSILDNDLYKFTMQQAVLRLYPGARAEYALTNRGGTPFPRGFGKVVQTQVDQMAGLSLDEAQRSWLARTCPFFTPEYLDFLSDYTYDPDQVVLKQEGESLAVWVKGNWSDTILWEVPLMAVISETYFALSGMKILDRNDIRKKNRNKAERFARHNVSFVDFGTRRRYSAANHRNLIEDILSVQGHTLAGTSNVQLAREFGITPVGTLAHEWIMFHSSLGSFSRANALALDAWAQVYPDVLGIALTDTYTTDNFLQSFTKERAARFTGVRQDSGDPIGFARKMLPHYRNLGIDPMTKTIVFSDGLDVDNAVAIHQFCRDKIHDAYGIGTSLTNDVGVTPLNIVIKLRRCSPGPAAAWYPTVKISDDPGKQTGEKDAVDQCLRELSS